MYSACAHSVDTRTQLCADCIAECNGKLQVSVEGKDVPSPIRSFTQAGFDDILLTEIIRQV
jgi:hypothetical protein